MIHDHNHNHDHSHAHWSGDYNRAFAIGVTLNIIFVVIEAGYGFYADSLALIADAGHNLSDVLSLLLAWAASIIAARAATEKRTYGFRKATVIASLASAVLLLVALGGITWEAIDRFSDLKPVAGLPVIIVASIGVVINGLTALLFVKGQQHDLNIKAAFLHMAADAVVSLGVVIAGLFILFKGWYWIDPVISLVIVAAVIYGSWGLLRDSLNYAMDAVPEDIDIPSIKDYLLSIEQVEQIHDLHVWPLSTTETALTVHIVVKDDALNNDLLRTIQQHLYDHFDIKHATVQVESCLTDNDCMLNDV